MLVIFFIKMKIEIVYYKSPVGVLEIRGISNAVSHILFLNSWKGSKIDETEIDFIKPKSAAIKNCFKQLDEYFNGRRTQFNIDITQDGTGFQQTVWKELLNCGVDLINTDELEELNVFLKENKK